MCTVEAGAGVTNSSRVQFSCCVVVPCASQLNEDSKVIREKNWDPTRDRQKNVHKQNKLAHWSASPTSYTHHTHCNANSTCTHSWKHIHTHVAATSPAAISSNSTIVTVSIRKLQNMSFPLELERCAKLASRASNSSVKIPTSLEILSVQWFHLSFFV